jgi:hypothetical protein
MPEAAEDLEKVREGREAQAVAVLEEIRQIPALTELLILAVAAAEHFLLHLAQAAPVS